MRTKRAFDYAAARARLKAIIAEQDRKRGRPLTASEKLRNLFEVLTEEDVGMSVSYQEDAEPYLNKQHNEQ